MGKNSKRKTKKQNHCIPRKEEENSLIKNNEIGEQKKNPLLKKLASSPHIYTY